MIRTAICLVAISAGLAGAQPAAQQQAKQHFKQAKTLQEAGNYDAAALEYAAAYELDHRPEMLFNIAQVQRLGKHKREAIDYYERYLAAQPDGAGAREARQWIAELSRQIEPERATDKPVAPEKAPTVPPAPNGPPGEVPSHPPPRDPVTAPAAAQSSPQLRIAGFATAGAGVLALGAGVLFGMRARSASDSISGHQGDWTDAEKQTFEDGQRANRNMMIAYVAGGALVATGGILYYLGSRTHVAPVVGTQTAGLTVWGRF